jgi:hypothetical protein
LRDYLKKVPPPIRATTGPDGRFQVAVEKAFFERSPLQEPWRYTHVVAIAEGLGLGFSDSAESDYDRELTVRLPHDDVPLSGRLLDLEGRPVSGASVRIAAVYAPPGSDLTPFLAEASKTRTRLIELRSKCLNKEWRFLPYFQPIPAATSGSDGRFEIRGVGRERLVDLEIKGPATRWVRISVLTRLTPPTDLVEYYRTRNPWIERYYGSPFELALAPSRPYAGLVRDRDTGEPIPNATVEACAFADQNFLNHTLIETRTDSRGRFVLAGMPIGRGNEVVVTPPEDRPHLPARYKLPNLTGSNPEPIDLRLKRGVWLSGRVTDRASGNPLEARVRYHAALDNPHLDEAPGFADLDFGSNQDRGSRYTSEDGSYRIAVLPGAGLLTLHFVKGGAYSRDTTSSMPRPNEAGFRPFAYGLGDAWSSLQVGGKEAHLDFALSSISTRTVHGLIVDPDGNSVTGARYYGMFDIQYWYSIERTNQFDIADLRPRKPRTLSRLLSIRDRDQLGSYLFPEDTRPVAIVQEARRLAGYAEVGWDTPDPVRVTLRPWAAVLARVVDGDGQPHSEIGIEPKIVLKNRARNNWISHWTERVFTDARGNLRIDGLVPGLPYRLVFEDDNGVQTNRGVDLEPLKSGETRQLGDLKVELPGDAR